MATAQLTFEDNSLAQALYGEHGKHLDIVSRSLGVKHQVRGHQVTVEGPEAEVRLAGRVLQELYELLHSGYPVLAQDVQYTIRILQDKESASVKDIFLDTVYISAMKRRISPKSLNQKRYIEAMRAHDIVFGVGPAGTGKTYLAMAMAVAALVNNEFIRIVLTRPAVEAGEKLGFLPGDLAEKVNPYLRPLYDALHDMMDFEKATRLVQRGIIEVAPLAFMRGRTLNDSFVILDEAQNTTSEQMMMFLTRLGFGSKAVITGDVTQIDLAPGARSGLVEARDLLAGVEGIAFVHFTERDVVRHPLVQDIIRAYESRRNRRSGQRRSTSRVNLKQGEARGSRPGPWSTLMPEKDLPKSISRIFGMGRSLRARLPKSLSRKVVLSPWQDRGARVGLLLVLSLLLALILSPRISQPQRQYLVGDIARENVKAIGEFLVEDVETTAQRQQELLTQMPPVFDLQEQLAEKVQQRLQKAMDYMRRISQEAVALAPGGSGEAAAKGKAKPAVPYKILLEHKPEFDRILGVTIPKPTFQLLAKIEFSPYLEAMISQVVTQFLKQGVISSRALLKPEPREITGAAPAFQEGDGGAAALRLYRTGRGAEIRGGILPGCGRGVVSGRTVAGVRSDPIPAGAQRFPQLGRNPGAPAGPPEGITAGLLQGEARRDADAGRRAHHAPAPGEIGGPEQDLPPEPGRADLPGDLPLPRRAAGGLLPVGPPLPAALFPPLAGPGLSGGPAPDQHPAEQRSPGAGGQPGPEPAAGGPQPGLPPAPGTTRHLCRHVPGSGNRGGGGLSRAPPSPP